MGLKALNNFGLPESDLRRRAKHLYCFIIAHRVAFIDAPLGASLDCWLARRVHHPEHASGGTIS